MSVEIQRSVPLGGSSSPPHHRSIETHENRVSSKKAPTINPNRVSSEKAPTITEFLEKIGYSTDVLTNWFLDGRIVAEKNAIIVELLNQYCTKEAVLDVLKKFPAMNDYIERSASENFKALVDSYSTSSVKSEIKKNEDVAIMSLINPSFSKDIAQKSFEPNFEQISKALDFWSRSKFEAIKKQQQSILESYTISMAPYSSRASDVGMSSSTFDGGHSVTSIERAKLQYLNGIRTSAMLGFQECIILSRSFKRPIVAVKNYVVDSVYGEEFFDNGAKPIFVVNYNNYHFEGWQPAELKDHYKPGDMCFGRKLPGNRDYNYGPNDCLIGAIRADIDANQALNGFYSNNQQIRAYLAQEHDQFSSSAAGYIPDRSQFWKEQVFRVDDIDQNPEEIRNYAGINLIVTPVGTTIEDCDDSEIQRLSGDIRNGRRHGTWFECDHTGRYEQVYVNGGKGNRTQTHRRGEALGRLIPV